MAGKCTRVFVGKTNLTCSKNELFCWEKTLMTTVSLREKNDVQEKIFRAHFYATWRLLSKSLAGSRCLGSAKLQYGLTCKPKQFHCRWTDFFSVRQQRKTQTCKRNWLENYKTVASLAWYSHQIPSEVIVVRRYGVFSFTQFFIRFPPVGFGIINISLFSTSWDTFNSQCYETVFFPYSSNKLPAILLTILVKSKWMCS